MKFDPQFFSAVPTVDLENPTKLIDGWNFSATDFCRKQFVSGPSCKAHYESMKNGQNDAPVQCPYGFASVRTKISDKVFAYTGFVPFPRIGGDTERRRAKDFKDSKFSIANLNKLKANQEQMADHFSSTEDAVLASYPPALHEIRKYNRNIKQEAERLCREERPENPEFANYRLVRIWKTADLMTGQFEVLDLIANQDLAALPLKTKSEVFKTIHKCVHIYEGIAQESGLTFSLDGDSPIALVCDKTFPILATVFFENAVKYSLPNSEIRVSVKGVSASSCDIVISNIGKPFQGNAQALFQKGVRGTNEKEGSGMGLYLAKLVADQHKAKISLVIANPKNGASKWEFKITLPIIGFKGKST